MSDKTVGREVLGRDNALRKYIEIEEWGGNVLIRQLSGRQVSEIQQLATEAVDAQKKQVRDRRKLSRFNFALIRDSWINEDGSAVLSDADYEAISDEPHAATEKLSNEIAAFNHLNERAEVGVKKNLDATPNGVSGFS